MDTRASGRKINSSCKVKIYFSAPIGLEDTSMFPNLVAEMLLNGWTEEEVQKVIGGNFIRVLTEVETVWHINFFMILDLKMIVISTCRCETNSKKLNRTRA